LREDALSVALSVTLFCHKEMCTVHCKICGISKNNSAQTSSSRCFCSPTNVPLLFNQHRRERMKIMHSIMS